MCLKSLFEKHTLKCLTGGVIVGVLALGVGMGALHATGTKEFCGQCHSMKHEAAMSYVETAPSGTPEDCLKCHSKVAHGANHLEGGIKVE